jgi:hypothetical protein
VVGGERYRGQRSASRGWWETQTEGRIRSGKGVVDLAEEHIQID